MFTTACLGMMFPQSSGLYRLSSRETCYPISCQAQEPFHSLLWVAFLHKRLANKDGSAPCLLHKGHMLWSEDSALSRHEEAPPLHLQQHPGLPEVSSSVVHMQRQRCKRSNSHPEHSCKASGPGVSLFPRAYKAVPVCSSVQVWAMVFSSAAELSLRVLTTKGNDAASNGVKQTHLLPGRAVHDALVVLQVNLERLQVPVVDAQHHIGWVQLQFEHALQLCTMEVTQMLGIVSRV